MSNKNQGFSYPILFMVGLAMILSLVLASLNQFTYDKIASQEEQNIQKSILYVLGVPYDSEENMADLVQNNLKKVDAGDYTYYEYTDQGKLVGYAFPIKGKALWGSVEGFGATDGQLQELLGVDFVKNSETPGLGARITEEWYKDQYRGVQLSGNGPYVIHRPAAGGNIDAITGATLTSNSVLDMVNSSIDLFKQEKGA